MKIKELVSKKDQDLQAELNKLQATLTKTRFEISSRETNNNASISKLKRDIARIKTILRERSIQREEEQDEKTA